MGMPQHYIPYGLWWSGVGNAINNTGNTFDNRVLRTMSSKTIPMLKKSSNGFRVDQNQMDASFLCFHRTENRLIKEICKNQVLVFWPPWSRPIVCKIRFPLIPRREHLAIYLRLAPGTASFHTNLACGYIMPIAISETNFAVARRSLGEWMGNVNYLRNLLRHASPKLRKPPC